MHFHGRCNNGLIEEFNSLRNEILQRQRFRIWIVSFTLASVGIVLGIIFNEDYIVNPLTNQNFIAFLLCFILVIINGALVLTIENTQQIMIISKYIIKFIEPKCPYIRWESTWTKYWTHEIKNKFPLPGYPWAIGRSLAIFYAILTLTIFVTVCLEKLERFSVLLSIILGLIALIQCIDLYFRISRGWKNPWEEKPIKRINNNLY